MSVTPLLRLNPELQRCLWLELTPTRLVLMPAFLALGLGGLHLVGVADVASWLTGMLYFLLVLWGARLAAESFAEETAQGTWDVQRLSASNPWSMTVGKLLGGTAYAWYGALCCLLALPFVRGVVDGYGLAMVLVGGLSAQAAALLAVIALHGFDPNRRRGPTTVAQLAGIALSFPAVLAVAGEALGGRQVWFGLDFSASGFVLVHQVVLLGWLVLGAAWLIRLQLGHAPSPLPFLAFTLWQVVFACGFLFRADLVPPLAVLSGIAALVAGAMAYLALLGSPLRVADVKRLLRASGGRAWALLPSWVPVAALAVALALTTIVVGGSERTVAAAGLALFVRDLALVVAVRLLSRRRTALTLSTLAVLLYGLLPEALDGIGGQALRAWIFPTMGAAAVSLIGPWAQAAAAAVLAALAWQRRKGA